MIYNKMAQHGELSQYTQQRPQLHYFDGFQIGVGSTDITIFCPFPVKEMRFTMSYSYEANAQCFLIMTIPNLCLDGQVTCTLNKLVQHNGASFHYSESMNESNAIRYVFKSPQIINGSYRIFITDPLGGGPAITDSYGLLHIEFLG